MELGKFATIETMEEWGRKIKRNALNMSRWRLAAQLSG